MKFQFIALSTIENDEGVGMRSLDEVKEVEVLVYNTVKEVQLGSTYRVSVVMVQSNVRQWEVEGVRRPS